MTISSLSIAWEIRANALELVNGKENTYKLNLENGKTYIITTTDECKAISARRESERDGLCDKIKSAACNFFGVSTNQRIVHSFNNILTEKQRDSALKGEKENNAIEQREDFKYKSSTDYYTRTETLSKEFKMTLPTKKNMEEVNNNHVIRKYIDNIHKKIGACKTYKYSVSFLPMTTGLVVQVDVKSNAFTTGPVKNFWPIFNNQFVQT